MMDRAGGSDTGPRTGWEGGPRDKVPYARRVISGPDHRRRAAIAAAPAGAQTPPAAVTATGTTANCPWLSTHLTIARRVAMVMSHMTLSDEITMVEGQGTSQPYVFYMAANPRLCIPAMGLEDGPVGVGDGLTGVTELPSAVSLAAAFDPS